MNPEPYLVARLVKSVAMLALDADVQIQYLTRIGVAPLADELALDLHESLLALPNLGGQAWMTRDALESLHAIDRIFESAVDPAFWSVDSLRDGTEWSRIRQLAREVLTAL